MAKSLEEWKTQVFNHTIDLDNDQSYDCVDVSKSWIVYLTDQPWQTSAGWGNAKDIWYNWSGTYLDRIPRGNAPQLGDIVCMNGNIGGGYGHTGVVVGIAGQNITIYQENSFTQQPVYTGTYNAYVSYIQGFLRPKVAFDISTPPLENYQRVVGAGGVHYRTQPNTSAPDLQPVFAEGETMDFKGFVHGEAVSGNDVWFVGRYTGGYSWSGAFTDTGTHDLPDMTAPAPLQGFQRQVGNSVINYRSAPVLDAGNVLKTFNPGEVLDFSNWTHGALVDGTNVWFQGKYTGGWSHAGGFTDQTTHDLTEVAIVPTPVPVDPTPEDLSQKIADISDNNKVTDYAALKAAVRAVVAKAGHTGVSYGGVQPLNSDPVFSATKAAMGEKLAGAYWYGYASLDPEVEAQAFVTTVGQVPTTFAYYLDIEELDGQTVDQVNTWADKFCKKVDSLTNKVTGMYMNEDWFNNVITPTTRGARPIWLAHYDEPINLNAVTNQVAHQYTSKGTVPGVAGYVDISAVKDSFFTPTVIVPTDPTDPTDPTPVDPTPTPTVTLLQQILEILKKILSFLKIKGPNV